MGSILSLLSAAPAANATTDFSAGAGGASPTPLQALAPDMAALKDQFAQLLGQGAANLTPGTTKASLVASSNLNNNTQDAGQDTAAANNASALYSSLFQPFRLTAEQVATVQHSDVAEPVVAENSNISSLASQLQKQFQQQAGKQAETVANKISPLAAFQQESYAFPTAPQPTKAAEQTATATQTQAPAANSMRAPATPLSDYFDLLQQWSVEGGIGQMPEDPTGQFHIEKTGDSFSVLSGEAQDPLVDYSLNGGMQIDLSAMAQPAATPAPVAAPVPAPVPMAQISVPVADDDSDDVAVALPAAQPSAAALVAQLKKLAEDNATHAKDDDASGTAATKSTDAQAKPVHPNATGPAFLAAQQTQADPENTPGTVPRSFRDAISDAAATAAATSAASTTTTNNAATLTMTHAAAKAADDTASVARHILPPQVHDQVNVRIRQALDDGQDEISIRLDPPQLGRVDVKMQVQDGKAQLQFSAEHKETLELLQRDMRGLERSLSDVGIKTDSGTMQFNLRQDQSGKQASGGEDQQQFSGFWGDDDENGTKDASLTPRVTEQQLLVSVKSGLDLKV